MVNPEIDWISLYYSLQQYVNLPLSQKEVQLKKYIIGCLLPAFSFSVYNLKNFDSNSIYFQYAQYCLANR